MLFKCKACGATLQKEDIDLPTGIASCGHCHAVMSFAEEMGIKPQPAPAPAPAAEERPLVPRPREIQVDDQPHRLLMTRRWFHPMLIFLAFFCLFWDGFLVVWYTAGAFFARQAGPASLIMFLFPLVHVAVGVGLTYYVIAGFFNRTVVTVTQERFSIVHGPLPWWGNRELRRDEVRQLYCQRHVSTNKNGSTSTNFSVNAVTADGQKLKLLSGLHDLDAAIYLEQQIEARMGIKDERVAGESLS